MCDIGYFLTLGASTRSLIVQCDDERQQEPIAPSKPVVAFVPGKAPTPQTATSKLHEVNWGMTEDDEEDEEDFMEDASARIAAFQPDPQAGYQKDPLRVLYQFCEYHGYDDPEFEHDEEKQGRLFICNGVVRSYGDDSIGRSKVLVARYVLQVPNVMKPIPVSGTAAKKKEAEVEAARQACHALEALGALKAMQKSGGGLGGRKRRKRRIVEGENDEEDDFFDRTTSGSHSSKNKGVVVVETYESLLEKWNLATDEWEQLGEQIADQEKQGQPKQQPSKEAKDEEEDDDDLDAYMANIEDSVHREAVNTLQRRRADLDKERERLRPLLELAKPASIQYLPWERKPPAAASAAAAAERKETIMPAKKPAVVPPSPVKRERSKSASPERKSSSNGVDTTAKPSSPKKPRSRVVGPRLTPEQLQHLHDQQEQAVTRQDHFVEQDEDIAEWVPPVNQRGDGQTDLNKRLGY